MRKALICALPFLSGLAYAGDNNLFQEFDNQISVGYGLVQNTSGYGTTNTIYPQTWVYSTSNILNFNAEHLTNIGVWLDVNANMSFGSGPVNQNPINGSNGGTYQSSDYGLNAKVGYGFPLLNQHLQVIPYALLGINNIDSSLQYVPSSNISANSYAYTAGAGGRLEYRVNSMLELYADQLIGYSWDQSGPVSGIMPQNNVVLISTIGAKLNVGSNIQLGIKGFYGNDQPQADNYTTNGYMIQPQWSIGGLVSIGVTY